MGAFGQYIGGILGDRTKKEPLLIVLAILLFPLLLAVGWSTGWILILVTAAYALVYFMAPPSYNALAAEYVAPQLRGRVFGLIFFGAFGIGSFAGVFGGLVAENFAAQPCNTAPARRTRWAVSRSASLTMSPYSIFQGVIAVIRKESHQTSALRRICRALPSGAKWSSRLVEFPR